MRKLAFETAAERKAYYESLEAPVDKASRQAQEAINTAKKTGAPVTPAMTAAAEEAAAQAAKSGAQAGIDDAAAVTKKAKPFRLGKAGKVGLGVTALGALGTGAYLLNKRKQAQPSPQKIAGIASSTIYSAFFSALSEEVGH